MRTPLPFSPLAPLVLLAGCSTFSLGTAPGRAQQMPDRMYGLGPGPVSKDVLKTGGWAFADQKDEVETWVLAAPEPGVGDVEAQLRMGKDGQREFRFLRVRYPQTRLATYQELVRRLSHLHGKPQSSREEAQFPLFVLDPGSDAPRPAKFIVHRWHGEEADLLLVGGLEASENLAEAMQYQLFFVPPNAPVESE